MTSIGNYLWSRLNATYVREGNFVKMDNTTIIHFTVNDTKYEVWLPKFQNNSYYDDYFSRNYPELLL
jgi:hypothetical protein